MTALYNSSAIELIYMIAMFLMMFVGNSNFAGFPLILIIGPLALVFSMALAGRRRSISLILYVLALSIIFALMAFQSAPRTYDQNFGLLPFTLILQLTTFSMLLEKRHFKFTSPGGAVFFASLLGLILYIVLLAATKEGSRASFIFGPNMAYRVVCFFGGLAIWSAPGHFNRALICLLMLGGVYLTGSRGGSVTLGVIFLLLLIKYRKDARLFFLGGAALLLPIIILGMPTGRIFYFGLSDGTLARINFLRELSIKFDSIGNSYDQFYADYFVHGFPYPHNIFAELIYFYGFLGIGLCFIVCVSFFKACRCLTTHSGFSIANLAAVGYVVFMVGASFSGDLRDNSYLLSGSIFFLLKEIKIWGYRIVDFASYFRGRKTLAGR